ncbi:hypothetical protein H0H93_001069, partial [Arthromyces matolae]
MFPTGSSPSTTADLPPHIKSLYIKASKNPIHLSRLVKWGFIATAKSLTSGGSERWLCHPSILQLFAKQLDLDVPPSESQIGPTCPALQGLAGLGCAIQIANPTGAREVLESVWPKAWKWIVAVYRGFVLNVSVSKDDEVSETVGMCIEAIIL